MINRLKNLFINKKGNDHTSPFSKITFELDPQNSNDLIKLFSILKDNKSDLNNDLIILTLGERYKDKFWHPTEEELEVWNKKWLSAANQSDKNFELETEWDFVSWIEAIENAEIRYIDISIEGGKGNITLEQLSYPSGGVEASNYIVELFDGIVITNTMF